MRFTIKREELLKGLMIASRAIASKVAVAVLANLKLELNEKGLFITGSNYDLTIRTFVPYKQDEVEIIRNYKEGATLVNSKIFVEMVRKLVGEEFTLDVVDSTLATISCGGFESQLNCVRPEEYPDLDLDSDGTKLTLRREQFNTIVSQTAFAASTKEQRPILTALNLEAANGLLTITATDSARLAKKEVLIDSNVEFISNIPAKMMIEIDRLLENNDSVDIAFSDKKALFTLGRTEIATRLIAGDYPNTKGILPRITNHSLEINSQELMKAIELANTFSIDRENVVDLTMSENSVEISAKSDQVGSARSKIEMFRYNGEPLKISFNSEFVLSAIRALSAEDVTFLFVGEMKPFVIKNAADDSVIQIVTPVRTY